MSETAATNPPLRYGTFSNPPFQCVHTSRYGFDETVARLKRGLNEEDLWLIHEIDPQALLRQAGIPISPARQLLFFHPRLMRQILTASPDAIIEAPLKLVALHLPDASVSVRHLAAADQFGRYPGLKDLASEFTDLFERLVSAVRD